MKNTVVIVNYNDYKTTIRLINNIKDYKCIDEIVIVDNKSTDNSYIELLKLKCKRITILQSGENKGYSFGLNVGCKYLIDKYKECKIVISNSDIVIESEDVFKCIYDALNFEDVVVSPQIHQDDGVSRGWMIPKVSVEILTNFIGVHTKLSSKNLYPNEYYQGNVSKVEAVSGCFFGIMSTHLEDINYFDEEVFLYYEENILGVKTKNKNKNIIVLNKVSVLHDHAKTIDKSIKKLRKYDILKQSQYYFNKYYNDANKLELILLKLSIKIKRILLLIKYKIQ